MRSLMIGYLAQGDLDDKSKYLNHLAQAEAKGTSTGLRLANAPPGSVVQGEEGKDRGGSVWGAGNGCNEFGVVIGTYEGGVG
ncbi:hypothetical protein BHM03_00040038 [Ensete ventricosum]|nr:hypothetical protein BHM03_00040038 [Ensete ventricosum]